MFRDLAKTHRLEDRFNDVRLGRRKFNEFEAIETHRILGIAHELDLLFPLERQRQRRHHVAGAARSYLHSKQFHGNAIRYRLGFARASDHQSA